MLTRQQIHLLTTPPLVEYLGGTLLSHQLRIRKIQATQLFQLGREWPPRRIVEPRKVPDIAVLELGGTGMTTTGLFQDSLRIKSKQDGMHLYKLDSIIVRDTTQRHFCALITCGGKPYCFDGSSFSRLSPFDWKPFITTPSRVWTMKGAFFDTGQQIKWSLDSGYALLFYYRTD